MPSNPDSFMWLVTGLIGGTVLTLLFTGKIHEINFDKKLLYVVLAFVAIVVILGAILY